MKTTEGKKLAKIIETIRKNRVCAYHGERCDCKYGADRLEQFGGESGNGCPEMRVVSAILERMTNAEIKRILKRKKVDFFVELP